MTAAKMWNVSTLSAISVLMGLAVLSTVAKGRDEVRPPIAPACWYPLHGFRSICKILI